VADNNFIPAKDADFNNWLSNFATYALAHATALGLSTAQGETLQNDQTLWDAAYDAHLVEVQTAKVKTQSKNQTRKSATANLRALIRQLQANPNVTDEQRLALGIPVRKTGKTPVPAPSTRPVTEVERIEEFAHTLRIFDSASNKSAKPEGVELAEVRMKILPAGTPAPVDPSELDFAGTVSTTRMRHTFGASDAGKTAYYRLRWLNPRGEAGDWGPQTSATIAA
jgi:hypothetical protein